MIRIVLSVAPVLLASALLNPSDAETNPYLRPIDTLSITLNEEKKIPLSDIYTLFDTYDRDDEPGCGVAVYHNGRTLYRGTFGMANLDYGIPLADSSVFYMTSISKQVTAAAVGLLILREKLSLDDRVSSYLDDWPDWAEEVRIKHLLYHTSGLPDLFDVMNIAGISVSNVMTTDDYISVIKKGESLKRPPGSYFSYTSSGYMVLAALIEKITGTDFSVFVDTEIIKVLGMRNTHFHDNRYRVIPNRVISYAPLETRYQEYREGCNAGTSPSETHPTKFRQTYLGNFQGVGPGGLYSTLLDWQHWEALWHDSAFLPPETASEFEKLKQLMTRRPVVNGDTINYGMGLEIETWQGVRMEGHAGSFMGFQSDVRRFPEYGISVLTLCNRDDADPSDINRSLARIILKEPMEAFLKPYGGIYHNAELEVDLEVTIDKGTLRLNRRLPPNEIITEAERDTWEAGSWDIVFQRDKEGNITGFLVSTGRTREVEFLRK